MSAALPCRAPLLWILLPFGAGLAVAHRWALPDGAIVPLLGVTGGASLLTLLGAWRNRRSLWLAGLLSASALGGVVYLHVRAPYLHDWSRRPPRETTLVLAIEHVFPTATTARTRSGLALVADRDENDPGLRGRKVYWSAMRRGPVPERGGVYRLRGVVEPLPRAGEGKGFEDYLANVGVRQRCVRAQVLEEIEPPGQLARFQQAAARRLEAILSHHLENWPAERSLYVAMLLGGKADMSEQQENAFIRSGTFHIFSISGLHVAVIALALRSTLRWLRLPRRAEVATTLVALWLYVQVTGASPPAVRAFLMSAFLLSAKEFRLPGNAFAALVGSAFTMLLLDPLQLFSTGFQMSYSVVASLILMGPAFSDACAARWHPFAYLPALHWQPWQHAVDYLGRKIIVALASGWVAFLASVPSGIGYFGLFSPGSLLANLIVIPLSSGVLYLGFASLVLGLVGFGVASAGINVCAAALLFGIDRLLQWAVTLPGMAFTAQYRGDWLAWVGMLLVLAAFLTGASQRWTRWPGRFALPAIVVAGLLVLGVTWG